MRLLQMEDKYSEKSNETFLSDFSDQLIANEVIFGNLSVGVIVFDTEGTICQMNTCALENLKWKRENVIARNLFDVLGLFQEERNILPEVVARLKQGEKFVELTSRVYIRDLRGKNKFFVKGQFLGQREYGRLSRAIFLFRNYEEELTKEYLLNLSLSKTKIYPWFFDLERNKMIIDSRWYKHLGYPEGDGSLDTERFAALLHPDDRDTLLHALELQISGTLNEDAFTYRLLRADGTWEWFEEQSFYLGEVDGAPYRIVGVCQSIQEHKTIEENLIEARDKAQVSDKLKSAFLANMSHEIRTPLNAIVGFSNLLTNDDIVFNEDEKREYAQLINTNSEQLLLLISDILDLSKIEANTMEFHFSESSLNDLLLDIYHAQVLNMPAGVELIMDVPESGICLRTDPMRLKQVINNLINNAVKFTTEGSIRFGYRVEEEADRVAFVVEDTGKGIAKEQQDKIFERFYKADPFKGGVGLGLSISQTIIRYLGGSIELTSEPGKGTCFIVYHPLKCHV